MACKNICQDVKRLWEENKKENNVTRIEYEYVHNKTSQLNPPNMYSTYLWQLLPTTYTYFILYRYRYRHTSCVNYVCVSVMRKTLLNMMQFQHTKCRTIWIIKKLACFNYDMIYKEYIKLSRPILLQALCSLPFVKKSILL